MFHLSKLKPSDWVSVLKNITYPIGVRSGKVIFTPDLRATLLRAFQIAKQASQETVGILELFFSCLFDPQVSKILQQSGADVSSIKDSLMWEEEKSTHAKTNTKSFAFEFSLDLIL